MEKASDTPAIVSIDRTEQDEEKSGETKLVEPVCSQSSQRRMRKDDSGIQAESTSSSDGEECGDTVKKKPLSKIQIKKAQLATDKSSPDSGHHEGVYDLEAMDVELTGGGDASTSLASGTTEDSSKTTEADNVTKITETESTQFKRTNCRSRSYRVRDSDDSDTDDEEKIEAVKSDDHNDAADTTLDSDDIEIESSRKINEKEKETGNTFAVNTKHKWFVTQEIVHREYGHKAYYINNDLFRLKAYSSLHMVQRLELMAKMKQHEGCVNALNFNITGTKLASGSDDLKIVVWDWTTSQPLFVFDSGHRSNVFQTKFMPLGADCHIVSCARDGQVRLAELSETGVCKNTKRLAQHKGGAHKLALEFQNPHNFLSCGEDAVVYEFDVRDSKANKLLTCIEEDRKIALYSIFANPVDNNEFVVGGRDHYVRIYDKRRISESSDAPVKKFCPHHLLTADVKANVTCVVWNYCGDEVLATYNDEDIYTFCTGHSDGADYTHRYWGHRNNATVKGVNYFGPRCEWIVSGSDCGNIFFWNHDNEDIVQFMPGDEGGVVNCLEPHPQIPILATSGLDDDIKIWVPSAEEAPSLKGLKKTIKSNLKDRDDDNNRDPEAFDGQMLWYLMHHLRRTNRRQARQEEGQENVSLSESDSDSDSGSNPVQCAPS